MKLQFIETNSLPPLAWCARVSPAGGPVEVRHGTSVETHGDCFFEGAWDGDFPVFDLTQVTILCGTGGQAEANRVRFAGSSDRICPLFSIAKKEAVYVSNSPIFVMEAAGCAPRALYPFYSYDLVRIWRKGLYCLSGELKLADGEKLRVHFSAVLSVDGAGRCQYEPLRLDPAPENFPDYFSLLDNGVKAVVANAGALGRKNTYRPLAALSKGYDSSAAAALARRAGCGEAFSFTDSKQVDPRVDSGFENAPFLGMTCTEYPRWGYLEKSGLPEAEFGLMGCNSPVSMAAMEGQLAGRILLAGYHGDVVWTPGWPTLCQQHTSSWIKFVAAVGQLEFRLREDYFMFLPAYIAARHSRAIDGINHAEEMRPWSVGGDYDRPIPRRIGEEGGLPRENFGRRKRAGAVVRYDTETNFSPAGWEDLRQFLKKRDQAAGPWACFYWRSRLRLLFFFWDWTAYEKKLRRPSTPWIRRFPYFFSTEPFRLPWEFSFTFQWMCHRLRGRYGCAGEKGTVPPGPEH